MAPLRITVAAWCATLHVLAAASIVAGPVFFVDAPGGEDLPGIGSEVLPWATINFAMQQIDARGVTNGYTLYLREGVYRETVHSPVSGSILGDAVVSSYPGEQAVVSGAEVKTGWTATGMPGVYKVSLSDAQCTHRGVYEDGNPLHGARHPNGEEVLLVAEALTRESVTDPALRNLTDAQITTAWLEIMTEHAWHARARIQSYDRTTSTATFYTDALQNDLVQTNDLGQYKHRTIDPQSPYRLVDSLSLLDTAGEYHYVVHGPGAGGDLYVIPFSGGDPGESTVEVVARSSVWEFLETTRHVRVADLEVRHAGRHGLLFEGTATHGVGWSTAPSDIVLDNLHVHDVGGHGICLYTSFTNIHVTGCTIEGNGEHGLVANAWDIGTGAYRPANLHVLTNRFERNGGSGVYLSDLSGAVVSANHFDTHGLHNLDSTISIHKSSDVVVLGNEVRRAGGNGILIEGTRQLRAHDIEIRDNVIDESSWLNDPARFGWVTGIWVSDADDCVVSGNRCRTPNGIAIHVDAGDRNRIVHNVFTSVLDNYPAYSLSAVGLENADGTDTNETLGFARHNIIAHNLVIGDFSHGWSVYADLPVPTRDNIYSNLIANNIFCSLNPTRDVYMVTLASEVDHGLNRYDHNVYYAPHAAGMIFRLDGVVSDNLEKFQAAAGQEAHSLVGDPRWLAPSAGDFRLRSVSPCVDTGTVIPGVNDGFRGGAPDIGPFEFDGTAVIINVEHPASTRTIEWEAVSNAVYQLQSSTALVRSVWTDLDGPVTARTIHASASDDEPAQSPLYYRVVLKEWP